MKLNQEDLENMELALRYYIDQSEEYGEEEEPEVIELHKRVKEELKKSKEE